MPFIDENFPPCDEALYDSKATDGNAADFDVIAWKRPEDFQSSSQLFVDGVEPGDVVQGSLGDCYFLGALSVLAMNFERLRALVTEYDEEEGKATVRFYKNGQWIDVEIDTQIPIDRYNTPTFACCNAADESWVPIMEKAYAKCHGSYEALEGGDTLAALIDLTGGAGTHISLQDDEVQEDIEDGSLWKQVMSWDTKGDLMGCSITRPPGGERETVMDDGLLAGHAYGILDVAEVAGHRLVRIRNPWGKHEWTGDWSDASDLWTDDIKAELDYECADDGSFWMSFEDFTSRYTRMIVCHHFDGYNRLVEQGRWTDKTSGGRPSMATWASNPQFKLKVTGRGHTFVSLCQDDARMSGKDAYDSAIAFTVFSSSDGTRLQSFDNDAVMVESGVYQYDREVSGGFRAEEGEYIIVPCQYERSVHAQDFCVRVFSQAEIEWSEFTPVSTTEFHSVWEEDSAAGCPNNDTWSSNPQFILNVDETREVTITLAQEPVPGKDPVFMGYYLQSSSGRAVSRCSPAATVLKTGFTNVFRQSLSESLEPGSYTLIPSTFYPGEEAGFSVSVSVIGDMDGISFYPHEQRAAAQREAKAAEARAAAALAEEEELRRQEEAEAEALAERQREEDEARLEAQAAEEEAQRAAEAAAEAAEAEEEEAAAAAAAAAAARKEAARLARQAQRRAAAVEEKLRMAEELAENRRLAEEAAAEAAAAAEEAEAAAAEAAEAETDDEEPEDVAGDDGAVVEDPQAVKPEKKGKKRHRKQQADDDRKRAMRGQHERKRMNKGKKQQMEARRAARRAQKKAKQEAQRERKEARRLERRARQQQKAESRGRAKRRGGRSKGHGGKGHGRGNGRNRGKGPGRGKGKGKGRRGKGRRAAYGGSSESDTSNSSTSGTDSSADNLKDAFRTLDVNGDGVIDAVEFREMLMSRGEPLSEEEANDLFSGFDANNDGMLDIREFCRMMRRM